MAFSWAVVVAGISFLAYFTKLPLFLLPVLLFGAFLASGGKSFPRIFFRTFFRDLRFIFLAASLTIKIKKLLKNQNTIAEVFGQVVARHPQKAAFIFEEKTWTFQDVEDYSNRVANYFKSEGYKKGDKVALFLESCPEFVCLWLGLSKLGVITVLINTNLRHDSLCHCVSTADTRAILYGSDLAVAVKDIRNRMPEKMQFYCLGAVSSLDDSPVSLIKELETFQPKPPDVNPQNSTTSKDALMYIYTSGTTGYPKPVVITQQNFIALGFIGIFFRVTPEDIIYCTLPLYHTAGGGLGVGSCLVQGNTLVLRRKFSASKFWDDCVQNKATVIQYIGEVCRYLLAQPYCPSERQNTVRVAFGNGLRPQIWKEFQSRFSIEHIGEFFGATEGNVGLFNTDNTPGSCGFVSVIVPGLIPLSLLKVDPSSGELLRGENGLAIPAGPGEPGLAAGKISKDNPLREYANTNEMSKKVFCDIFHKGDAYFFFGDLLVRDEYGYVYFHDRTGDTFRWRGENVSATEVETTMSKILGLRDVVVYGVQVPGTEGRAGMATIVDSESDIDLSGLVQGLNEQLPHYAHPRFLRIVDSVSVTGTFKLQKNKLKEEGFDVGKVQDKLLYYDLKEGQYRVLDEEKYAQINQGIIRM